MAISAAKKKRLQAVRAGKSDPSTYRLDWHGINPITRRTPTRQEKLNKQKHKDRWNPSYRSEDAICF